VNSVALAVVVLVPVLSNAFAPRGACTAAVRAAIFGVEVDSETQLRDIESVHCLPLDVVVGVGDVMQEPCQG
jgi:hypothetical protein